jgi:hypothetical protein
MLVGCATLPLQSASGARVKRIIIYERFAFSHPRATELSGVELEPAVELLDRHGVLRLSGRTFVTPALDGSDLTVGVELTSGETRVVYLDNCSEPHVCGFAKEAVSTGLLARLPQTCAGEIDCWCENTSHCWEPARRSEL